jgi:hypothetical protein
VTEDRPAPPGAGRALHAGPGRFRDDDGSADPAAAAALSAYAAGTGSEHAALTALAAARLLVPVVAQPGPDAGSPAAGGPAAGGTALAGGDKNSDMVLPALIGHDGRRALPAFTSVAALARWQPGARPVPAEAALVWQAAVQDAGAVVIDVAGPVPLSVEGARLAALARGEPAPLPWEDPDVLGVVAAAVRAAAATPEGAASLAGCAVGPGVDGSDLLIELSVAPGAGPGAGPALAEQVGAAVLAGLGARLRRGVDLALSAGPG